MNATDPRPEALDLLDLIAHKYSGISFRKLLRLYHKALLSRFYTPPLVIMTEEVIDWKNALEKCGDDEDFLKELLVDLRKEAAEHKAAIDGASATESIDYTTIKKQASDINSAASSILCRQLAKSAENVEIAARSASNDDNFKDCLEKLNIAFTNFQSYLENLGV